jgi:SOS-response transcriptional repressor LexA
MNEYELIGRRLRELRESHGDSAIDLARVLGCAEGTIYHYEKGRRKITLVDLKKVADHYGVPLGYFLGPASEEDRKVAGLNRLAKETKRLRQEVEELTGDMARLVWVPIRGTVPGGYPDFREEVDLEEHFPVPKALVSDPQKAFALRVTGNSMNGRGILDGDVVVVDMTLEPHSGDIVVVRKDEEAVLRIYKRDDQGPYLEAANEGYKRLRLKEGQIVGVVVYSGREHRRNQ